MEMSPKDDLISLSMFCKSQDLSLPSRITREYIEEEFSIVATPVTWRYRREDLERFIPRMNLKTINKKIVKKKYLKMFEIKNSGLKVLVNQADDEDFKTILEQITPIEIEFIEIELKKKFENGSNIIKALVSLDKELFQCKVQKLWKDSVYRNVELYVVTDNKLMEAIMGD